MADLQDKTHQARIAALSLAQCNSVVTLLRAHGQDGHADGMEAALNMVMTIVAEELGRDTLSQAIAWASDELGRGADLRALVNPPH
ncbi:MAG: hypothetical protein AAF495_18570 [Pseudomonadota bacterium]